MLPLFPIALEVDGKKCVFNKILRGCKKTKYKDKNFFVQSSKENRRKKKTKMYASDFFHQKICIYICVYA